MEFVQTNIAAIIATMVILLIIIGIWYYLSNIGTYEYWQLESQEMNHAAKQVLAAAKSDSKSSSASRRIYGKYVHGNILENNMLPNLDMNININTTAAIKNSIYSLYADTLLELENYPEIINEKTALDVNAMLDHIEIVTELNVEPARENLRAAKLKETYYEPVTIKSDPQNVHEPEVVDELKRKYQAIQRRNEQVIQTPIAALRDAVKHRPLAIRAIDTMKGNTISSLADTEGNVLQNIWTRINSPDNIGRKEDLTAALAEALESIFDGGKATCISGRCSRVIDSLTLMDVDPEIAQPVKTTEILRGEIFALASDVVQSEIINNQLVRDYMNGISDNTTVVPLLKSVIDKKIREHYGHIKANILENLIRDAQAGVE